MKYVPIYQLQIAHHHDVRPRQNIAGKLQMANRPHSIYQYLTWLRSFQYKLLFNFAIKVMFSLLYIFCLHFYLINIHIFDYPDSRLSGLFTEVPTSPDNRGSTVFGVVFYCPSLFWETRIKRNFKKFTILTRKPRSHVRILVNQARPLPAMRHACRESW